MINPDGTTLTYTQGPKAQALAAGQTLTETYTYTVSDIGSAPHVHGLRGLLTGAGHTATQTITITVTGVNDPPDAFDDTATVGEDALETTIDVLTNDKDADTNPTPDTLTVTAVDSIALRYGAAAVSTTGVVTYTPDNRADAIAAGATGTDTFTYTLSDGHGGTDTATVTVTITGANDAPVLANQNQVLNIRESATGAVPVSVTDVDAGDTYTISVTQGSRGAVEVAGNTVTYVPSAATQAALLAGQTMTDTFTYTVTDTGRATATATVSVVITGEGSTGVLSTGEWVPVDVWLDGDRGVIRNEDGTLTEIGYSADDGWTVGAGVDYGFDAGDLALDGRVVWAEVEADDFDDGTIAVVNLDTGEVERVTDSIGAAYQFGEVTDVAVDRRVETAEVVYAVDSRGTVYEIDAQTRQVVRSAETLSFEFRTDASVTADAAAASASPKLAVAPGSKTVYVANGNRISVVQKRQAVSAARLVGEGDEPGAETEQLVHEADLDITLGAGDEITAIEVGADGTLYATVVSTNASASAVSGARLVRRLEHPNPVA